MGGAYDKILVLERGRRAQSVPGTEGTIIEAQYRLAGRVLRFPGARRIGGKRGCRGSYANLACA